MKINGIAGTQLFGESDFSLTLCPLTRCIFLKAENLLLQLTFSEDERIVVANNLLLAASQEQ
jgi:hypothetical protein